MVTTYKNTVNIAGAGFGLFNSGKMPLNQGPIFGAGVPGGGALTAPVIESFTQGTTAPFGTSELTLAKPTGVTIGETLILVLVSDEASGNNIYTTPAGWTLRRSSGGNAADVWVGIYIREADGTEGATLSIASTNATVGLGGWYLRVSGAGDIESLGVTVNVAAATEALIESRIALTPALSIVGLVADGADNAPFTTPTNDYATIGVLTSGAGAGGLAAGLYQKNAVKDAVSSTTIGIATLDGIVAFNLLIQPFGVDEATIPLFHPSFVPTQYGLSGKTVTNNDALAQIRLYASGAKPIKGKRYFEANLTFGGGSGSGDIGIVDDVGRQGGLLTATGNISDSTGATGSTGTTSGIVVSLSGTGYTISATGLGSGGIVGLATPNEANILMVAYDADTGEFWFGVNGTWNGDPSAGTSPTRTLVIPTPYVAINAENPGATGTLYTASGELTYTPPTGFTPLDDPIML